VGPLTTTGTLGDEFRGKCVYHPVWNFNVAHARSVAAAGRGVTQCDVRRHVKPRPYCVAGLLEMSSEDWAAITPTAVPIRQLVPTQEGLGIDRLVALAAGGPREGDDPYGHTIRHAGVLYIHDGHHAWALRWLRGQQHIFVRVKPVNLACAKPCGRCGTEGEH
jgi:hypothetical protein